MNRVTDEDVLDLSTYESDPNDFMDTEHLRTRDLALDLLEARAAVAAAAAALAACEADYAAAVRLISAFYDGPGRYDSMFEWNKRADIILSSPRAVKALEGR